MNSAGCTARALPQWTAPWSFTAGRTSWAATASATPFRKLGNAVTRNRARRRLREVSRLNADKLAVGYDIVLVARGKTASAPFAELNAAYLRLAKKLSRLEETP